MNESPEVLLRGFAFRVVDLGEGCRTGGREKGKAVIKPDGDLCAEWGAREVAEFEDALILPPSPPGNIPAPRTDSSGPSFSSVTNFLNSPFQVIGN